MKPETEFLLQYMQKDAGVAAQTAQGLSGAFQSARNILRGQKSLRAEQKAIQDYQKLTGALPEGVKNVDQSTLGQRLQGLAEAARGGWTQGRGTQIKAEAAAAEARQLAKAQKAEAGRAAKIQKAEARLQEVSPQYQRVKQENQEIENALSELKARRNVRAAAEPAALPPRLPAPASQSSGPAIGPAPAPATPIAAQRPTQVVARREVPQAIQPIAAAPTATPVTPVAPTPAAPAPTPAPTPTPAAPAPTPAPTPTPAAPAPAPAPTPAALAPAPTPTPAAPAPAPTPTPGAPRRVRRRERRPHAAAPAAPAEIAETAETAETAAQPNPPGEITARGLVAGSALTGLGYMGVRGLQNSGEQKARGQDYMRNMQHNMMAPMPSMTVTASYEKFASEKLALEPPIVYGTNAAVAKSLADALGRKLIEAPIDALHESVKKRYYDEPTWRKNYSQVVKEDPLLSETHKQSPEVLANAFETIKRFSPSLAKDRLATRSLLRHVTMTGGEMDFATMKMLAETEKFHRESKGR